MAAQKITYRKVEFPKEHNMNLPAGNALMACYFPEPGVPYYRHVPGIGYIEVDVLPVGEDYFVAYKDVTNDLALETNTHDTTDLALNPNPHVVCYFPEPNVTYYRQVHFYYGLEYIVTYTLPVGDRYFVKVTK